MRGIVENRRRLVAAVVNIPDSFPGGTYTEQHRTAWHSTAHLRHSGDERGHGGAFDKGGDHDWERECEEEERGGHHLCVRERERDARKLPAHALQPLACARLKVVV